MPLVLTVIALALALVSGHALAFKGAPQLFLTVSLDHTEYLPGEPILVGVTIENHGFGAFEDMAFLDQYHQFLEFHLMRDGEPVERWVRRHADIIYTAEGIRLEPGEKICDIASLDYEHFGKPDTLVHAGTPLPLELSPGAYALRATFRARLGVREELPQVVVNSNSLQFTILEPSAIPDSEVRVLNLIHSSNQSTRWNDTNASLFLTSRYMYLASWRLSDSVDVPALARKVADQGSVVSAARLLEGRYVRVRGPRLEADGRAWLDTVTRDDPGEGLSCFLSTWRKLADRDRELSRNRK